jgi:HPt (histidine-containing phosphotransfer) domain-containing protein
MKTKDAHKLKVLDLDQIKALKELDDRCDDQSLLFQLIDMFFIQSLALLNDIDMVYKAKKFDLLARHAHKMKGSCSSLGGVQASYLCQCIEDAARELDEFSVGVLIEDLKEVHADLVKHLLVEQQCFS